MPPGVGMPGHPSAAIATFPSRLASGTGASSARLGWTTNCPGSIVRPMAATDVNRLFGRAEQAFLSGQLEAARADLDQVRRISGDHPAVLHLLALVEKKGGDLRASRAAFELALGLAPNDAQIANNFANLLRDLGEEQEALHWYGTALANAPGFADAIYNRALLLQRLDRHEEALADLDAIRANGTAEAKVESARGAILMKLDRFDEAAQAFDAALTADPARPTALHGRARLAMERGEPGAPELYRRALANRPDDPTLLLGLCEALEAAGDAGGLELLKAAVEASPGWIEGHEVLARMRSEAGEPETFASHYQSSLQERPKDRALHQSHWRSLMRGELYSEALTALNRSGEVLPEDDEMQFTRAVLTSEAGDPATAMALLDRYGGATDTAGFQFARGRIALRAGRTDQAAEALEQATNIDVGFILAWAHLDLAWRLEGDERHQWLSGQPGLHACTDIGLGDREIAELAVRLREIHKARSHPIGQSLRGGTQTRGLLLHRGEPQIRRLRDALEGAVQEHMRRLPARDDLHPLLRHRDRPVAIGGSWSVRLTDGGFHVNHVHPEGVLSSACYIALPPSIGCADSREGWLELGRPPRELELPLEPLVTIEPKVGRLALFPSYMFHGTRRFDQGERLTVAFDVEPR